MALVLVDTNMLLAGLPAEMAEAMKATLSQFVIVDCGMGPVADQSVSIRRASLIAGQKKLRLPDAIILATAIVHSGVLLTRNTKDFKPGPHVVVPYSL
jgi:hypothetical protein